MLKKFFLGIVLVVILAATACGKPSSDFNYRLNNIIGPYVFSIAAWESRAIPSEISKSFKTRQLDNNVQAVLDYFSHASGEQQKKEIVEGIIGDQIKKVLGEQGIYNPIDVIELKFTFPPVNFKLDQPPKLLIISPRDRIENLENVTMKQDISIEQVEDIEAEVDALSVSSIIVDTGGFSGTYPSFVVDNGELRFTINAAAEEWLHQYLAFKPLGFRYVLDVMGLSKDYDVVTMNETVAGIVSDEIGEMVYKRYYDEVIEEEKRQNEQNSFDFNKEMREIRKAVDQYLKEGNIDQAEQFMDAKRQYLQSKGYYIRKLNQAYFAFYGCYADEPTSVSPIGTELKKLRSQSSSLKEFLDKVSAMTSHQDLISILK